MMPVHRIIDIRSHRSYLQITSPRCRARPLISNFLAGNTVGIRRQGPYSVSDSSPRLAGGPCLSIPRPAGMGCAGVRCCRTLEPPTLVSEATLQELAFQHATATPCRATWHDISVLPMPSEIVSPLTVTVQNSHDPSARARKEKGTGDRQGS